MPADGKVRQRRERRTVKEVSFLEWYHFLCSANANANVKACSEAQLNGITEKLWTATSTPYLSPWKYIFPQVLSSSDVRDKISGGERCKADRAAMLHLP